jgi:N-acyl-D-amino-acid deacylase
MSRSRLSLVALGLVCLTAPAFFLADAGEPARKKIPITGAADNRLASLDKTMVEFLKVHPEIPGAVLAVARDEKIVYSRGFGYAEGKRLMAPTAKLRIASISKPITAAAILRLIESGRLKLQDKVFTILDLEEPKKVKFDRRWRQVTIAHLLHHTGGWDRGQSFDPMFHNRAICAKLHIVSPARQDDIIRYMLTRPLDFEPGTRYAYSNFGYCLLGRVIEKVSGRKYEDFVRQEVLLPIGMRDTHLGRTLREDRLDGEVVYNAGGRKAPAILGPNLGRPVLLPYGVWCLEAMDSHGAWVSTGPDLVRFALAFNHPDRCKVLKAQSVRALFARPDGPAGSIERGRDNVVYYSCGWNVRLYNNGVRNIYHSGLLPGTSTILVHRGADQVSWAVLFNWQEPGKPAPATLIDPLVQRAVTAVKAWP